MSKAAASRFVYVTYIKVSPERLWQALTDSDFTPKYWLGAIAEAEWKAGGAWKLKFPDGRIADAGEIVAFDPPRRLVIRWRNEWSPEIHAEGFSLCTMELEPAGDAVKLTVTHEIDVENSKLIGNVTTGWPMVLSNLKSLLETGAVVLPARY